jgi:hypothetical protein
MFMPKDAFAEPNSSTSLEHTFTTNAYLMEVVSSFMFSVDCDASSSLSVSLILDLEQSRC